MYTINEEAKVIAQDVKIDERIEQYNQRQSFIMLKDHKENFKNNPKCRLINPAKSDIGIVSKEHIDIINKTIIEKTDVNQWRNTDAVVTWFQNTENKDINSFIKFDIVDFYPSISKDLLINAVNFPKSITPINDKINKTILHPCKSLLFNKNEVWVKKDNPDFDVTMSSFDGLELCELVGLYLLDILRKEYDDNKFGLNRDDGHSCFQNLSGPESEKTKKKLWKIFKKHGLNITVESNLQMTDFLGVTFDLRTRTSHPYRKVNNELLYIHKQSNQSPSITKHIPAMISERISNISCDKECFDKAALDYNNALKNWFQRKYQIHTMSSKKKKTQQKHFMV